MKHHSICINLICRNELKFVILDMEITSQETTVQATKSWLNRGQKSSLNYK